MNIKKFAVPIIGAFIILSFSGCTLPFVADSSASDEHGISYQAYDNKAYSQEEVINYITQAVSKNEDTCYIFVTDESLIDANTWLLYVNGIEQIQVEYRRVKDGFNMKVTFDCWDNYAIMHAYNTKDTSVLNERQLTLYNKYISVLNEVTSPYNSDVENELAIHDYLVSNITYVEKEDSIFNAYDALINGEAVCSGYAECFKTFMDMLGIENDTISGTAGNQQHIWNVVKLDGVWYQVDVTWDDPVGSTSKYVDHSYFNITSADMALDHAWDHDRFSAFESNSSSYPYSYASIAKLPNVHSQSELNRLIKNAISSKNERLEFISSDSNIDIKKAITAAGTQLSYSYKNTPRATYTLYSVTFTY